MTCVLDVVRFRIKLQVSDGVDYADFVMPDSIAENLLKKTCSQMLNEVEVYICVCVCGNL